MEVSTTRYILKEITNEAVASLQQTGSQIADLRNAMSFQKLDNYANTRHYPDGSVVRCVSCFGQLTVYQLKAPTKSIMSTTTTTPGDVPTAESEKITVEVDRLGIYFHYAGTDYPQSKLMITQVDAENQFVVKNTIPVVKNSGFRSLATLGEENLPAGISWSKSAQKFILFYYRRPPVIAIEEADAVVSLIDTSGHIGNIRRLASVNPNEYFEVLRTDVSKAIYYLRFWWDGKFQYLMTLASNLRPILTETNDVVKTLTDPFSAVFPARGMTMYSDKTILWWNRNSEHQEATGNSVILDKPTGEKLGFNPCRDSEGIVCAAECGDKLVYVVVTRNNVAPNPFGIASCELRLCPNKYNPIQYTVIKTASRTYTSGGGGIGGYTEGVPWYNPVTTFLASTVFTRLYYSPAHKLLIVFQPALSVPNNIDDGTYFVADYPNVIRAFDMEGTEVYSAEFPRTVYTRDETLECYFTDVKLVTTLTRGK